MCVRDGNIYFYHVQPDPCWKIILKILKISVNCDKVYKQITFQRKKKSPFNCVKFEILLYLDVKKAEIKAK